jgi:hypothetical protein
MDCQVSQSMQLQVKLALRAQYVAVLLKMLPSHGVHVETAAGT